MNEETSKGRHFGGKNNYILFGQWRDDRTFPFLISSRCDSIPPHIGQHQAFLALHSSD